ncbi:DUF853 family protein [Patescibacteria group bacterium]|nr:DUF853 family protein [Patescibacteria group bacterium]MBU1952842.1 DUF853 family protein [Patescibacteria group bacterium]
MIYTCKWNTDKNSLPLQDDFKLQFKAQNQDDIPLILIDDNDNKQSVIYSYPKNAIHLSSLVDWINDFQPKKNEVIELVQVTGTSFKIRIGSRESNDAEGIYLGKLKDSYAQYTSHRNFILPTEDLVTHTFICGATGSGKTVLGKAIVEELALKEIPAIIVDLKGDLSSLGLMAPQYTPETIGSWINTEPSKKEALCQQKVNEINTGLDEFGLTSEKVKTYIDSLSVAVFTPKAGKGIHLSISSPLAAPKDIASLMLSDRSEVLEMIGSYTDSFIRSLFAERKIGRLDKYKTFLHEIVQYCWEHSISLNGKEGLVTVQQMINEPPFREIGGMNLNKFIDDKMRVELANRIAMCLTGVEQLWFEGIPINIPMLLSRPTEHGDKTPVSIVNVSDLPFDEQMYVVSHLAYSIYNWARPQGDSGEKPRILFFIDEIGGGGGKQAFYPSHPYNPPSKPPLNVLLKKGRTFGISCLFATQNPGDIDYKGLSNCGTWFVGRLQTERDRRKIMEGISTAEIQIQNIKNKIEDLSFKEFLVKTKDGKVNFVKERWLVTYHKTLSENDLSTINGPEIKKHFQECAKITS